MRATLPAFDKYPVLFKIGENKITFRFKAVLYIVKKFFWNITGKMPVPEWEREFTFIIEE